jgi:DNA-binding transcriptional LysR family regulator
MEVKIEWLEAFLQTTELKSLTKASECLHISQPALSKKIRNLEDELGAQLLIRSSSGVTLTPSGQILLERSKKIFVNQTSDAIKTIPITDFDLIRQISAITREDSIHRQWLSLFEPNGVQSKLN